MALLIAVAAAAALRHQERFAGGFVLSSCFIQGSQQGVELKVANRPSRVLSLALSSGQAIPETVTGPKPRQVIFAQRLLAWRAPFVSQQRGCSGCRRRKPRNSRLQPYGSRLSSRDPA